MKNRNIVSLTDKFGVYTSIMDQVMNYLDVTLKKCPKDVYEDLPYLKKLYIPQEDIPKFNKFEYDDLIQIGDKYYLPIKVVKWEYNKTMTAYYYDTHVNRLFEVTIDEILGDKKIMVEGNIIRLLPLSKLAV